MKGLSYTPAPSLCIYETFCSTLWGSARNRGINEKTWSIAKNSKYSSHYRWTFCPAVGNIGVISVRYHLPLFVVLFCSVFRFRGYGLFGLRKLNFRVPPQNKRWKTMSYLRRYINYKYKQKILCKWPTWCTNSSLCLYFYL